MKNKTDLAALKAAVVMLSLDSRAREALHKMDLEDETRYAWTIIWHQL